MGIFNTLRFITQHPLNRNQKTKAVFRWLGWHLRSRLISGEVVVPFVNKSKLLVSAGMGGATGNIYTGLHEFPEMSFTLHLLRADDLFIDVGTNVGSYTVLAAGVTKAKCISIEPIPRIYQNFLKNIWLNHIENLVDARNIGIGDKKGILKFTSGLETVNHVLRENETNGTQALEIPVETLNGIAGDLNPLLIKIDVEGFESAVIAGADRVLANPSLLAVIAELHGGGKLYYYDEKEIHQKMIGYGFQSYLYSPFDRILTFSGEMNHPPYSTIYIRNENQVKERLKSAAAFTVRGIKI